MRHNVDTSHNCLPEFSSAPQREKFLIDNGEWRMTGHFGFSYVGLLFLILLFIPNMIWTGKKPQGYTSEKENKVLLMFERIGEMLTTICALIFKDFNIHGWSDWTWWLIAAVVLMAMYELWWIRYFRSERKMADFYSSFLGVPLAGASLPVLSFFLLGIYGKVIWLAVAAVILGIGHIGIHMQHRMELKTSLSDAPGADGE